MKKLLSLLSVLTISGTAVPTTIAASPYQKEEKLEIINHKIKKRDNNENNKINMTKIVIHTNGIVFSSGIILNNKLYFGSNDHNVYEYDPTTGQQKIVITTNGEVWSSGVILNNKLYFGSKDHNVYEYDPTTGQQKIVITTNGEVWFSSGIILNNKLYIGSDDHNVYEYDPTTGQQKIVIRTKANIHSSGVILNNKVYFGSDDHNVYEYDPTTGQQKIVITTNWWIPSSGIAFNNKLYIGSEDSNIYEYDPVTKQQKIIRIAKGAVFSSGIILNNKLYFGSKDHNVYEYDPTTGQQKIVITTNGEVWSSGVILNNKLYFGSKDHNVYEYDSATKEQKIVITANDWILSSGIVFNNKLYFGSDDHNVYEYSEYYLNSNLGQINDNSDIVILNELNYLNPDLDISKLEIINKTNNSAIIKEKNSFNNENITNVKYSINNKLNKILNLNELIKKAIFFKFRDENSNLKFKEIKYIDSNNLNFSNVEVTKKSKLLTGIDFKYPCSDKEVVNRTSNPKLFYVPGCEYNSKSELTFQIRKGIIKNQEKNQENIWTLNSDDENKLIEFIYWNNKDNEIINTLSNDFIFSNLNEQKQEMILNMFKEPDSRFELNPNEKLKTNYSVRINKSEIILNLKQKITGIISAKIIDDNNKEKTIILSIKEAMQILQRYNLLPDEITINKDNSITFNGEAFLSFKREGQLKTSINTFVV